jgi:hypothetical protein
MSDIHLPIRSIVGTRYTSSPLPANKYKKEISIYGTLKALNLIQCYANEEV